MPGYDFENLIKAWSKSAFGLFVGLAFLYAFNSWFLCVLAWAFLFFIPFTNRNAENTINRMVFGIVMGILLFWAFGFGDSPIGLGLDLGVSGVVPYLGIVVFFGAAFFIGISFWNKNSIFLLIGVGLIFLSMLMMEPWKWNTSAIIFTGIWLFGLVSGLASDIESRTTTGIFIIIGSFIIYAIGVGSQDVGVAFFGEWWPTVHNYASSVFQPLGNAWSQLSGTIGNAWMLLTNPVGYATMLMNGSYAYNPVGQTGAYGLEITSFEVTPVLIEQPFMITANIKNSGGYDAQNVEIEISSGSNAPMSSSGSRIKISELGINTDKCKNNDKDYRCVYYFDEKQDNNFPRQNIWQTYYSGNVKCKAVKDYDLRKKYIPINITLRYKYTTDSVLGKGTEKLEFISKDEWERLSKMDKLQLKDVQSEYTSGPVRFPIGTPGLKSPIREDQDFHIGLSILSAQKGGKIENIESVELTYPKDFDIDNCVPYAKPECKDSHCTIKWESMKSGDKYFYCHVKKLEGELGNSPTKSYVITAKAKYTYSISQEKIIKVDFGSWCCTDDDCAKDQKCCPEVPGGKGVCAPKC